MIYNDLHGDPWRSFDCVSSGICFCYNRCRKEGIKIKMFETVFYIVKSIDGDYANLVREDDLDMEPKLVARALLPVEISEGSKVKYEMLQYTMA